MHIRKVVGIAFVAMGLASSGYSVWKFSTKAENKNQDELEKLYAKLEKYRADFIKLTNEYNYQNWGDVQSHALGYFQNLNAAVSAIYAIITMSEKTPEKVNNALQFIKNSINNDFAWIKSTHQKRRLEEAVKELATHKANMKPPPPLLSDKEGIEKVKGAIRVFLHGLENFYNKRLEAFGRDPLWGMPN